MQLEKALSQISEIHAQVLKTEVFRGYRAATMLVTAAVATGVEGVSQDQVALVIVPFFAAFDFISDRFRTLTNLIGDTFAAFVLTRVFKGDQAVNITAPSV